MSTQAKVSLQLDTLKLNKSLIISELSADGVAQKLYNQVLEGETSAVQVAEMINFVNKVGESLKSKEDETGKNKWVDLVRDEIKNNSDDGRSYTSKYGTKFSLFEAGTKYNYSVCGDPLWNYYNTQMEDIKKKMKVREKFLGSITDSFPVGNVMIPETGELHENVELHPPTKTSTSTYKTELLKD